MNDKSSFVGFLNSNWEFQENDLNFFLITNVLSAVNKVLHLVNCCVEFWHLTKSKRGALSDEDGLASFLFTQTKPELH